MFFYHLTHYQFQYSYYFISCSYSATRSLFFLLTPCPPISTLFPYTTLFRSTFSSTVATETFPSLIAGRRFSRFMNLANGIDRKSTRLNSSHLGISYAVFCLKKKNNMFILNEKVINFKIIPEIKPLPAQLWFV